MNYYRGNALYDYLENHNCDNFYFVKGNMWLLVYGDRQSNPKLLVLLCAVPSADYGNGYISSAEKIAGEYLNELSRLSRLPRISVRFPSDAEEVTKVKVREHGAGYRETDMADLKQIFAAYGLDVPARSQSTGKYLNSATSSAYHNWQRSELGYGVTVCDLDLIRLRGGKISTVYELKRSYIRWDAWQPYRDDYANFELVSKFAVSAGIGFKILYNVRTKSPFFDDVSVLKVFDFDHRNAVKAKETGKVRIEDFIK